MILLDRNDDFKLDQFSTEVKGQDARIGWRYFGGTTHFLIVVTDAFSEYDLDGLKQELEEKGLRDKNLILDGRCDIAKVPGQVAQVYLINEQQYSRDMRGWRCNLRVITGGQVVPLRIAVYACTVEDQTVINVFRGKEAGKDGQPENVVYLPQTIHYTMTVKSFLGKKAIVRVENVANYPDGCVVYSLPEVNVDIPLTAAALGRELEIKLPGNDEPQFFIAKEYKKFYKIEENVRK